MSVIHENLVRLEDKVRMPQFIEDQMLKKDSGIFAFDLPKEIINDFHDLRGHISIANARKKTKVLAIAGSVPGEGSSTIATTLSFLMAGGLTRRLGVNSKDRKKEGPVTPVQDELNLDTCFTQDFSALVRNGSFKPAVDVMRATSNFGPNQGENDNMQWNTGERVEHKNEVLLIDANLQNPSLHKYFGLDRGPGLAEILEKNDDWQKVIHLVKESDLCVITCGENRANPAELLASERMRKMVREIRRVFNYIVFDSPPVLTSVAAVSLASVVDGVVLIVRAGQTRWEVAQNAKHKLLAAEANVLGVALNRRKAGIPDGLYQRLVG